jgi:hypothetical protein
MGRVSEGADVWRTDFPNRENEMRPPCIHPDHPSQAMRN